VESEAPATPVCYRHSDRPTRISCSECGKPICPDCTVDAAVGQKCRECAAPQGRHRSVQVRNTWGVNFGSTPVTLTLIIINVAIFVIGSVSLAADAWFIENWALIKQFTADGEWWRILSAAFLHGGLFHLVMNMYVLYLLGANLERGAGSAPYLALYLAAAAAGGAVSQLTDPNVGGRVLVISVGASGAIFGLFGAWLSASYQQRHTPAGRAMLNQFFVLLVINAAIPFLIPQIDWRAHLGGFAAGVVIHQLWARLEGRPAETAARRVAIAAFIGLLSVLSVMVLA